MTSVARAWFGGAVGGCIWTVLVPAVAIWTTSPQSSQAQATPDSKPAAENKEPAEQELSPEDKALLARYEAKQKLIRSLGTAGPTIGRLGKVAEINVPEGYIFIAGDKVDAFNQAHGNTTNPGEVGAL